MAVTVRDFGEHEGQRVDAFTLTSEAGVEVDIMSYGVVVRDWRVPVAEGLRSVVLGFEEFAPYPTHSPYFGAIAGRVANRIARAEFELEGKSYRLPVNEGDYCLHGGPRGLGQQVWTAEPDSAGNAVRFSHHSPDGAMGFPGTVEFTATYRLEGKALSLELAAMPDRPTPISLVQHQYFNLGTTDTVLDHRFQLEGHAYTEVSPNLIPTGAILPVAGTKWDLRRPRTLREPDGTPVAYDGNLALATGRRLEDPIATVFAPDDSLTLHLWSDRPGLQFYNGVYTNIPVPGLGGSNYKFFSGFCLEDQAFPDALHNPHFPSIIHTPDRPYSHWCRFEIG